MEMTLPLESEYIKKIKKSPAALLHLIFFQHRLTNGLKLRFFIDVRTRKNAPENVMKTLELLLGSDVFSSKSVDIKNNFKNRRRLCFANCTTNGT